VAPKAKLQVVCVGKVKPPFQEAVADYERRISSFTSFRADEVAVAPTGGGDRTAMRKEAERLRSKLITGARLIAVDPGGRSPKSSEAFGGWLTRQMDGARPVSFVIGGPLGLDHGLRGDADESLSLGPLTMPHQLARVVLAEQLYRALATAAGHPYSR